MIYHHFGSETHHLPSSARCFDLSETIQLDKVMFVNQRLAGLERCQVAVDNI